MECCLAPSEPPPPPTSEEVEDRLVLLVTGRATAEEVADWAARWDFADDPGIDDPHIWDTIGILAGADLKTGPSTYLHGQSDFEHWLENFAPDLHWQNLIPALIGMTSKSSCLAWSPAQNRERRWPTGPHRGCIPTGTTFRTSGCIAR